MSLLNKLFYIITAHIFEFFSLFFPLREDLIIFNSTNNQSFNFNSKYLFLYFLRNNSSIKPLFVINNIGVSSQLTSEYGNHFISTNSLAGLWLASRAKTWVSSDIVTPYLVFPWLKNNKRISFHIGHGVPLKKIILLEENIPFIKKIHRIVRTRIFTHVTCYSNEFKEVMEKTFRNKRINYIPIGQPRNDLLVVSSREKQYKKLKNHINGLKPDSNTVLYAPTWRPYAKTRFFPFSDLSATELNDQLVESNTFIFLRDHPSYKAELPLEFNNLSNVCYLDSNLVSDISEFMSFFDKLITDYSSIYFDYLCLDRPIAFIPYDIEKYVKKIGFTVPYEKITPGDHIMNGRDFLKFISSTDDDLSDLRLNISTLINAKNNGNCLENYNYIVSLLDKSKVNNK